MRNMRRAYFGLPTIALAAAVLLCGWANAQQQPQFEVTSVKPVADTSEPTSMRSPSPGSFEAQNVPLRALICDAYLLQPFQVIGGPQWTDTAGWSVSAEASSTAAPEALTGAEIQAQYARTLVMLQGLLKDRFALRVHKETRRLPIYVLTAEGGLKLPPPKCVQNGPDAAAHSAAICGLMHIASDGRHQTLDGSGIPIARLILLLSRIVDRPVVDKTGFKGTFDLHLTWTSEEAQPSMSPQLSPTLPTALATGIPPRGAEPSLVSALKTELGLKLASKMGPVGVLVIDHAAMPTAN